jgi:transaldolase
MNRLNPLVLLKECGQSIWLDYIARSILEDGTLNRLIRDDNLAGMTSNPAIFEKAIVETDYYEPAIAEMSRRGSATEEIYERLAIYDVRRAADLFRPVFDQTGGRDGYVSLEVSPLLAHDTEASINEARRLWKILERPNVMIKVPGTREGLPAIRQLIRDGVNVNVTLLFSVDRYLEVTHMFMAGLEDRIEDGKPVDHIASVASFFLSRIDVKVDKMLDTIAASDDSQKAEAAHQARGQIAIASAGKAYGEFLKQYSQPRWSLLEQHGSRQQRLLWASTSTKDPGYSDVKYVEALIGPDTVNTVPLETLEAYREHGDPAPRLQHAVATADRHLKQLRELGIDLREVDDGLETEGVQKFIDPFQRLLSTIDDVRKHTRMQRA